MKVVIVEDEPQAARWLQNLLGEVEPSATVVSVLDSVEQAVTYFRSGTAPDLVFMDIQLADGLSFDICRQVNIAAPIIFTTAYNEYALRAFKVNSIDYLLKPLDRDELRQALLKFKALTSGRDNQQLLTSLQLAMDMMARKYKERFVIKVGEHLRSVEVRDILYFTSIEKMTYAVTADGRRHILDFTMDQLEELLSPDRYFRISRKYIVAVDAIQDMISHVNSRLRLVLRNCDDQDVVVARERVQDFKTWLDR